MDIQQDRLRELVFYDPDTGVFTRASTPSRRHADKVGQPCGGVSASTGYVEMYVDGANRLAHRLAWIYVHGSIPEGMRIDHANRDRTDNRLANLRLATHADNLRNCKLRPDNTSGVKGVSFDRSRGKWTAAVGRVKLGRFDTLADATAARQAAAREAFGAFANE